MNGEYVEKCKCGSYYNIARCSFVSEVLTKADYSSEGSLIRAQWQMVTE